MTTARRATWAAALLLALHLGGASARAEGVVLDDFEQLAGWTATASEGTHVWVAPEAGHTGMGMRIGFDLNVGGGYVIVRKNFTVALPENYAFSFQLRGDARPNNFEFKLADARGRNVLLLRRPQRPVGPDVEDAFDDVDPDFAAIAVAQEPPFDPEPRVVFGDPHRECVAPYSTKRGAGGNQRNCSACVP